MQMRIFRDTCFHSSDRQKMQKFGNFELLCYCHNLKGGKFAICTFYKFIYPLNNPTSGVYLILNLRRVWSFRIPFLFFLNILFILLFRFWTSWTQNLYVIWNIYFLIRRYLYHSQDNIYARLFVAAFFITAKDENLS